MSSPAVELVVRVEYECSNVFERHGFREPLAMLVDHLDGKTVEFYALLSRLQSSCAKTICLHYLTSQSHVTTQC